MQGAIEIRRTLFVTLFLGSLCLVIPAFSEVHQCNGLWTDKPCAEAANRAPSATSSTVEEHSASSSAETAAAPISSAVSLTATENIENLSSGTTSSLESAQFTIKPLTKERPEPNMEWKREALTQNKWRFSGKLKGHGRTKISVIITKASYTGKVSRDYPAKSRIFNLPPWGGETDFSFQVDVPAPWRSWSWTWLMKAEYVGRWEGFRDFRGCCTAHDEEAECNREGAVVCRGGNLSTTCRCF